MENIEVWQVYIFDGHSMHFSLAKNTLRLSDILPNFKNDRINEINGINYTQHIDFFQNR